jgi:neutral ceramidase
MSGYSARTHPSEGVATDLWVKALALEDSKGTRVVIVTMDLVGIPRSISDTAAARIQKKYGLERSSLVFNCAHTHTGPVVWPNLSVMFFLTPEQQRVVDAYAHKLTDDLVTVVGAALADLSPAELSSGHGTAGFAANRRQGRGGNVKIGVNAKGPVDHDVPVLKVMSPDGKLRAVLFGYACHNTTLTAEFYKISGDYAGFAQLNLEQAHPGATAMFMILCGADQNPEPRSTFELVQQHGKALSQAVETVLAAPMKPVRAPIRAAYMTTELNFQPHTREQFEQEAKSDHKYKAARARAMLRTYDEGTPVRRLTWPAQAVRLDKSFTLLALGGEVVVDYQLRAKREYPKENLMVAGYSNEVMCYIPSLRVLKEGGYEVNDSMIYYGQPGPLAPDVEDLIFDTIHKVMKRVGAGK